MRFRDLLQALRLLKPSQSNADPDTTSTEPIEIGRQLAAAIAAQQRHEEARGERLTSPLAHLNYSSEAVRLWRWVDSSVDDQIGSEVKRYALLGGAERTVIRDSLNTNDFYKLLTFTRRSALAAIRNRDQVQIDLAFCALAMIALERIDWRDLMLADALTAHAGRRIGADVATIACNAAQLAEQPVAEVLSESRSKPINLANMCGLVEVATDEGIVLLETSYKRFAPKADLTSLGLSSATILDDGDYRISGIQIAGELPLVWLNSPERSPIARMVGNISGCISIQGVPGADPDPRSSGQSILVFLGEARNDQDAQEIATAADERTDALHTQLGIATGRLFAVIIQWSWMADTPPLEDRQSLERLRPVFERLLA